MMMYDARSTEVDPIVARQGHGVTWETTIQSEAYARYCYKRLLYHRLDKESRPQKP